MSEQPESLLSENCWRLAGLKWFLSVVGVTNQVLNFEDPKTAPEIDLVLLGKRKAKTFLAKKSHSPPPCFGLAHSWHVHRSNIRESSRRDNAHVEMMRYIAEIGGFEPSECMVQVSNTGKNTYLTTVPHFCALLVHGMR